MLRDIQENMIDTVVHEALSPTVGHSFTDDYSAILGNYNLEYKTLDYYFQVGEITMVQGWILHLSVVQTQITGLLNTIIPVLKSEKVSFKIVTDKETANNMLLGFLGKAQIGKLVSIYPENEEQAVHLAKKLIDLTGSFKGPSVLTDIHLGTIVYTRYGSFQPVLIKDLHNKEEKYIYDYKGQLVKDEHNIPFRMPKNIPYLFCEIKNSIHEQRKKWRSKYKPVSTLKEDARGNVYKALYFENLFRLKYCVIKQGFKNMASDETERNIHDRLIWQQKLYTELNSVIPMPRILDLLIEEQDSYLVMEYLQGISLYEKRKEVNYDSRSWFQLRPSQSLRLLNYLISICSYIDHLHQRGYVHRDIAPGNFLIDKKEEIYLIDLELAYFLNSNPQPPFQLGTAGFMSPEQQSAQIPTVKEDIYGIGALMLLVFTGISPVKFDNVDGEVLARHLQFLIGDSNIAHIIALCISRDPDTRPNLSDIQLALNEHKRLLQVNSKKSKIYTPSQELDFEKLQETISMAIEGLLLPPTIISDDFWYSKMVKDESFESPMNKDYMRYMGLSEGIGGPLYLLAKSARLGLPINSCKTSYFKNWQFIEENCIKLLPNVNPGLYMGAAGVAIILGENIRSNLLPDSTPNRGKIKDCLSISNTSLDLGNGIAGQGLAILKCKDFLTEKSTESLLNEIVDILINSQQKDGSWLLPYRKNQGEFDLAFDKGIPGIIFFFLEYLSKYPIDRVKQSALKALNWLFKKTDNLEDLFGPLASSKKTKYKNKSVDRKGILITLIKAYETMNTDYYKNLVEKSLQHYPANIIRGDFSQSKGLAGFGELYLEAWRVFQNEEWLGRAHWIANVYLCTFNKSSGCTGYWQIEENNPPTADFMEGTSGIIHFLIRCKNPLALGYRFLN